MKNELTGSWVQTFGLCVLNEAQRQRDVSQNFFEIL